MIDINAIRAVHAEASKMQKAVLRSAHTIDEIDTNENDVNVQISDATQAACDAVRAIIEIAETLLRPSA